MSVPARGVIYSKDRMLSGEIVAFVIGGASRFSNYTEEKEGNEVNRRRLIISCSE